MFCFAAALFELRLLNPTKSEIPAIIDKVYQVNDPYKIADSLTHLTSAQHDDLQKIFTDR
jgi:hypothetical protein